METPVWYSQKNVKSLNKGSEVSAKNFAFQGKHGVRNVISVIAILIVKIESGILNSSSLVGSL